jgi:hypothetical protein
MPGIGDETVFGTKAPYTEIHGCAIRFRNASYEKGSRRQRRPELVEFKASTSASIDGVDGIPT